jgi:hypothetical protein
MSAVALQHALATTDYMAAHAVRPLFSTSANIRFFFI